MKRICIRLVVLLLIAQVNLFGQAVTGVLVGTVLDASGAAVPNANITVINQGTSVTNKMITGAQGFYTFPNLVPGRYSVTVEAAGFKTLISKDNVVEVEKTTRVDLTLSPGAVSQQVTVTGQAPLVETTTSDIGSIIDLRQINNLPVNGRLFQTLMFLAPGTTPAAWGDQIENPAAAGSTAPGGAGGGTYASVNGFPFQGNLYLVDGILNVEPQNAYINIAIPFAEIAEMKMETSNPTAEYGTFGGAVVNLTTKTGTNQFHGQAFAYIRNTDFNASDYFTKLNPPYHAYQFGGELDGPIIRNKLFFSLDYQQLLQDAGSTGLLSVPTAAMRAGDLSGFGSPVTNTAACQMIASANGVASPVPCTASSVPAADISPIAAALLSPSVVPLPNLPGISNNYAYSVVGTQNMPQFDVRVDYPFSDRDRFFARASYARRDYTSPSPGTVFMYNGNADGANSSYNDVVGWDHFFSNTMINQARVGFSRYVTQAFADAFGISGNNLLGIPNGNISSLPITSGIAQFKITGFGSNGNPLTGDPGWVPNGLGRLANIFEFVDTVSWIHGRHSLKFGASAQRLQTSVRNAQNDPRGIVTFNGGYTGAGTQGSALADLLVGGPNEVQRDLFPSTPATRVTYWGFFGQDDLRVNNKLTLNLGLRWDIYTAPVDAHNHQSNFVASGPNAGMIQIASSSNRGPNVDTYFGNVAPRVGLAFTPDNGKTAFRSAFGISYFPDNFGANGGTLERNYPETLIQNNSALTSNCNSPGAATVLYSSCGSLIMSNGLPGITPSDIYAPLVQPATTPGGFVSPPPGFGVFSVAQDFRQSVAIAWNASFERQLTSDMSFRLAYVGNTGNHLYHDYQLNQCNPPSFTAATVPPAYPACLPFYSVNPNITTVDFRNGGGRSHYNAAQVEVQKRAARGLTLSAAYTWSKMMDDINNPIDSYATRQELATAGWQRNNYPQALVISYVYELPFGRNRQWLNTVSPLVDAFVGGWGVSGITTFRSGAPLLITGSTSDLLPQNGGQRADKVCASPRSNQPRTIAAWFDTSCFAQPQGFRFGNSGIGDVYGPRYQNWDFSVNKGVRFGPDGR
ncbi:MAG TPA: carboxypeptidase regulatory-like domain-containing protein, partial [Pseudacidobacterium sp.]|nr:carboxypeptidase regulatory-like domain-containing protein [Pseudacidobacterium sp.]